METHRQITRRRFRRIIAPLLQLTVPAVLLTLLFRNEEIRSGIARLLGGGDPLWLLAGLAAAGASIAANVVRWRIFLSLQNIFVPYPSLGGIFLVGTFFNLFLPGVVGGEVINALFLMRDHPGRRGAIVLSIAADHVSGLIAITAAAAIFATARADAFLGDPIGASAFWFMWIAIGGAFLLLGLSFVVTHRHIRNRIPERLPGREPFLRLCGVHDLIAGHWRKAALASGISFFILLAYYGSFYCAGRAFGIGVRYVDIVGVMPAVDVAAMVPVTISGLGVREVLRVELLDALAAVPGDAAVLLSLTGFSFMVFWGLIGGCLFPLMKTTRDPKSVSPTEPEQ